MELAEHMQKDEGKLCRVCDRKFYMYIFQEQKVDRVTELKEDIEASVQTY